MFELRDYTGFLTKIFFGYSFICMYTLNISARLSQWSGFKHDIFGCVDFKIVRWEILHL